MIIAIIVLVIALAGAIYFLYAEMDESIELKNRYDNLRREHEKLQEKYKVMKKRKNMSYWFSLLRNPDRGKIEIASMEFTRDIEVYDSPDDSPGYSEHMSAKMYGDGRIELHGDGHDTDDFRPSTEHQLQYYVDEVERYILAVL